MFFLSGSYCIKIFTNHVFLYCFLQNDQVGRNEKQTFLVAQKKGNKKLFFGHNENIQLFNLSCFNSYLFKCVWLKNAQYKLILYYQKLKKGKWRAIGHIFNLSIFVYSSRLCLIAFNTIWSIFKDLWHWLSRCQFHQLLTSKFFKWNVIFCIYILDFQFFHRRKLAEKLLLI